MVSTATSLLSSRHAHTAAVLQFAAAARQQRARSVYVCCVRVCVYVCVCDVCACVDGSYALACVAMLSLAHACPLALLLSSCTNVCTPTPQNSNPQPPTPNPQPATPNPQPPPSLSHTQRGQKSGATQRPACISVPVQTDTPHVWDLRLGNLRLVRE